MEYRYQETLSWFIPGFYFLCYMVIEIVCLYPDCQLSKFFFEIINTNISDALVAMIVFVIPIFSFIMGWMIDAAGGYLFRYIMKRPTTDAYNETYGMDEQGVDIIDFKKVNDKQAERVFDIARRTIDLDSVDRFYYRYVASRNMFTAQLILLCITLILTSFKLVDLDMTDYIYLIASLILLLIYNSIVARDLTTHARYVFLTYKNLCK